MRIRIDVCYCWYIKCALSRITALYKLLYSWHVICAYFLWGMYIINIYIYTLGKHKIHAHVQRTPTATMCLNYTCLGKFGVGWNYFWLILLGLLSFELLIMRMDDKLPPKRKNYHTRINWFCYNLVHFSEIYYSI